MWQDVPETLSSNSFIWKLFIKKITPFKRSCAGQFENMMVSPEKYSGFISDTKMISLQMTISAVLYVCIILLEILSSKKNKIGEYDFVDEDYNPNECGLLNHKLIALLALGVKLFPLYVNFKTNQNIRVVQDQYSFLFKNDCSDKMTNKKFGQTYDTLTFLSSRLAFVSYLIVFYAALELVCLLYKLETP